MELNDKIARLRKKKGLSQEQLANELEVSRQAVFKWESGENTPDLEKIKKLAKLFNVSFDVLLDDEKEVEDIKEAEVIPVNTNKKTLKFRNPFDSGIKLDTSKLANLEHGYAHGEKKIEGVYFQLTATKHKELLDKKEYSKIIRIQHDVCVDFFVDDKNKTFGFFFDGAPQFVCPFENFAGFSTSSDGPTTSFTKAPVVGVGIGKDASFGVGSIPLSQNRAPLRYYCSISYFDENGTLKNYEITFNCNRMYIVSDGTCNTPEKLIIWENALSLGTNTNITEINSYLEGIKEAKSQLENGSVELLPLDIPSLENEVKEGQDKKQKVRDKFTSVLETSKKRKRIAMIITLIVGGVLVLGGITTWAIINAVESNKTAEVSRGKVQHVIDLINNIGEVTLSSGPAITEAEEAYNQLTYEQKSQVTNYNQLQKARQKYENLLNEKREQDTKDDPSRSILLSDLNGSWQTYNNEWKIKDMGEEKSILYWTKNGYNPTVIEDYVDKSSYLKGYNSKTQRMEISLYHYVGENIQGSYLDVSMTYSNNTFKLYYGDEIFYKV